MLDLSLNVAPSCCFFHFGCQVALLQSPLNMKFVAQSKQHVRRACPALTVTGLGGFFVTAGAMPLVLMPFRSLATAIGGGMKESQSSNWSDWLQAIPRSVCNSYVVGIGLYTMLFGVVKSRKLERVRVEVKLNY